jgi:hypothetical protein
MTVPRARGGMAVLLVCSIGPFLARLGNRAGFSEMIAIAGGCLEIGRARGDRCQRDVAAPLRQVRLDRFAIDRTDAVLIQGFAPIGPDRLRRADARSTRLAMAPHRSRPGRAASRRPSRERQRGRRSFHREPPARQRGIVGRSTRRRQSCAHPVPLERVVGRQTGLRSRAFAQTPVLHRPNREPNPRGNHPAPRRGANPRRRLRSVEPTPMCERRSLHRSSPSA